MLVWVSKTLFLLVCQYHMELTLLVRYGQRKCWINARAWSYRELQVEATSGAQRK